MLQRVRLKDSSIVILLIFVQVMLFTSISYYLSGEWEQNRQADFVLHEGVSVANIPLGGLTEQEAVQKLNRFIEKENAAPLVLTEGDKLYPLNKKWFGIRYNINETVREAVKASQESSGLWGVWKEWRGTAPSLEIPLQVTYNRKQMAEKIEEIARKVNRQAIDAKGITRGKSLAVLGEQEGYQVDTEKTLDAVVRELQTFKHQSRVPLTITKDIPKVTKVHFQGIDTLLAEQKTVIDGTVPNRLVNAQKAAALLNGTIIMPNQKFSFNEKTAPFTSAKGYISMDDIIPGKNEDRTSEGVSQVASVLYTTAVKSRLTIIERHPHKYLTGYAVPGHDAFVDGNDFDLRFVNRAKTPVYIAAKVEKNELSIALYGGKPTSGTATLETRNMQSFPPDTIVKADPALVPPQEKIIKRGANGVRVKTYLSWREADGTIKNELLSDDYYKPLPNVIAAGVAPEGGNASENGSSTESQPPVEQAQIDTVEPSNSASTEEREVSETGSSNTDRIRVHGNVIYLD